jgi:hypothetical protein
MRRPAQRVKPRLAKTATFPAPISGWIRNENLAAPNARKPDGSKVYGAHTLENWFPTATGVRVRGGSLTHTQIGNGLLPVTALFKYVNGNNRSMFAATQDAVYDATAAVDVGLLVTDAGEELETDDGYALVWADSSSPAVVTGATGGDWSTVQFATAGGTFLRAVNGSDTPQVYDGASWSTAPAITGSGLDPTRLSHVWAFKNRLFFVEKNTLNAWYLPVDAIGGTAVKFPLGGVFNLGGSLLYGASWSLDTSEDGGLGEQCAFISTEGEVAVYKGTDPAASATWSKAGVYKIGKPRGPHAFIHAGGDLVIATDIGFVPLSQAIQRDFAALAPAAVSYPIETAWNEAVVDRTNDYWHCTIWPRKQMVLVTLPTETGETPEVFVANARTGAWGLFTGWEATCILEYEDRCFFGSTLGNVIEAEATGLDNGDAYECVCVPLFDPLKTPASLKTVSQSRATYHASRQMNLRLSAQRDYTTNLPTALADTSVSGPVWGSAIWGESVWSAPGGKQTYRVWKSTPGAGYALAVAVQIKSENLAPPDVELIQLDITYDVGDVGS